MNAPATSTSFSVCMSIILVYLCPLSRSLAQIFFSSNPLTGLLFFVAFALYDLDMALMVILGALAAIFSSKVADGERNSIALGMHGFCGALVGAAAFASLGSGEVSALISVIGGIATIPVAKAIGLLFNLPGLRHFNLPCLTAPFCTVSGVMLIATTKPHQGQAPIGPVNEQFIGYFLHAVLSGISEVVLVDSALAGGIILAGLFIAQWKMGLAALLGAAFESIASILLRETGTPSYLGLTGCSGVLVAIALGTVFIAGKWIPWLVTLGALFLLLPVSSLVELLGIPAYTWPFVLTTWLSLVIVSFVPGVSRTQEQPVA